MSQIYSTPSRAVANTAAIAAAISARAGRVRTDLEYIDSLERTRPLTREEQGRAEWLRWLSNRSPSNSPPSAALASLAAPGPVSSPPRVRPAA